MSKVVELIHIRDLDNSLNAEKHGVDESATCEGRLVKVKDPCMYSTVLYLQAWFLPVWKE